MSVDPMSKTAYLICERCAWMLPIATTEENERCPECEGALVVVDDHVLPEVA
jgi:transcription initiation factor IIE alpha subunit